MYIHRTSVQYVLLLSESVWRGRVEREREREMASSRTSGGVHRRRRVCRRVGHNHGVSRGTGQSVRVGSSASVSVSPLSEEGEAPLIELVNVHKSFGSKQVLRGVSLKVMKGEAIGVIGPSGTGKSTVLKIMAGLLEPDQGEVYVRGKKIEGLLAEGERGTD